MNEVLIKEEKNVGGIDKLENNTENGVVFHFSV